MTRELLIGGWRRAAFALLLVIPVTGLLLGALAGLAFAPADRISLAPAREVFASEAYRDTFLTSFLLGLTAAAIATPVGLLAAGFLARVSFIGRGFLRTALLLPLLLPPLIVALGLRESFDAGTVAGAFVVVVLTHALHGVALAVWLCGSAWTRIDGNAQETARVLGAGRWLAWRTVAWPALGPSVRAVAALTFGAAFVSVAAVLLVANPNVATLESTALQLSRQASPAAAAVLTLVNVAVLTLVAVASWPRPRLVQFAPARPRGLAFVAGAAAMLATLGLLTAAVAGLVDTLLGVTPAAGRRLDVLDRLVASEATGGALEPLIRSLVVAGVAALIVVLLSASAARLMRSGGTPRRDLAQAGLLLPVVLGPVAIAIALRDSLGLDAGLHLVVVAHVLVVYPLALRIVASAPREKRDATEVARTLGASRFRAWRALRLPRSVPALLAAFMVVAVISFGEVAATLRLAGSAETVSMVALHSATLAGGDVTLAAAVGLLAVLAGVVALALSARWWQVATGGGPR